MFSIALKLTNTRLPVIRLSLGLQSTKSTLVVKSVRFNVVNTGKRYTLFLTISLDDGKTYQLKFLWHLENGSKKNTLK